MKRSIVEMEIKSKTAEASYAEYNPDFDLTAVDRHKIISECILKCIEKLIDFGAIRYDEVEDRKFLVTIRRPEDVSIEDRSMNVVKVTSTEVEKV